MASPYQRFVSLPAVTLELFRPETATTYTQYIPGPHRVLQLRDPNDGQTSGHRWQTKRVHQYVRIGGMIYSRVLPPSCYADHFTQAKETTPFGPCEDNFGFIAEHFAKDLRRK